MVVHVAVLVREQSKQASLLVDGSAWRWEGRAKEGW